MAVGNNPIGNMVIKVDLDAMGFNKSMTGLKRQIKNVNTEMRANLSQFDRSEKSIKKYETHIDSLNKRLLLQEKAVEQAKKEYDDMVKAHGEGSAKAEEYAIKLNEQIALFNETEREINSLTKEFANFKKEQEMMNTGWYKTGNAIGNFSKDLGKVSTKIKDVGSGLTKRITLPVMGVTTAVGGMVAAFGWKRLVALDEAQAQLKGLGYNTEEVGRISEQVARAVDGGMTTMAEGTSIAAGALAAGVKEGKELEHYIKLVGDAAVGANRPVNEMAMIFNRVQGSGKLMTQELNMIEDGMPGFAQAMADHVADGSLESFRKMVTNGQVGSDEFLTVMDDFAGGMAEAYADSWSGMVANTKANIGIIGQNLLGGVFEKSKESIKEFLEVLRSDDLREKAAQIGESIGEHFSKVVDTVKSAIIWFNDLDKSKQKLILSVGAFAVAIGPVLLGIGTLGQIVSKTLLPISTLFKWLGKVKVFGLFGKAAGGAGKSVGMFGRLAVGLTNPVGIAITVITLLTTAFITAYKKSETFRNFIDKLIVKFKEFGSNVLEYIQPAIDGVVGFFNTIKEKITGFISSEGTQLTQAFSNIGTIITTVASAIGTAVSWAFDKVIKPIISFVMPFVEGIIKMVWGNIKGIITGALDVIMGAVKIFSGLFTGDFSKMWEGVKQIFSGAIKIVWNWIQLQFIGRILKDVGGLAKGFWGHIKNMWQWVKETFKNSISTVYNGVKNSFVGRIITSIINFVKNFRQRITNLWNGVKSTFTNSISTVYNGVKNSFVGRIITSIINFVKNFRSHISNLWTRVKEIFSRYISNIRQSIANSFVGRIIKSITNMKDRFIRIAKDMWTGVKKQFDKIVDGAKNLPGRIGKGIRNAKDKATNAMKSVGNGIISSAGKPFNKVVDGVNWVTGKLGIKKKIPKWDYPQYAKGTRGKGHPGGIAMIGEEGEELVKLPDGRSFISPSSHTVLDLPKGTHVVPHKPTMEILRKGMTHIPHYAKGTDGWLSSLASSVGDVFSYIKSPKKLLNKILDKISIGKQSGSIPKALVGGAWNYVKEKPYEYIKKMLGKAEEKGGALQAPVFGGKFRLSSVYGPRWGGFHGGVDFAAPTGTPIRSQSNGKVSFAGYGWNGGFGNLVRVVNGIYEHYYAHMSAVMAKTGQQVKQGDILGLVGSTGDSTGPHVHYEIRRNGQRLNPLTAGNFKGFKTGGLIQSKQLSWLAEDGFPEMVIPLDPKRRTDAMKLLALTAKMIDADSGKGKSKLPHQLPNVRGGRDDSNDELIALLVEQNQHLKQSNDLLTQLLAKNTDIIIDTDSLGKGTAKAVSKQQDRNTDMRLRYAGLRG